MLPWQPLVGVGWRPRGSASLRWEEVRAGASVLPLTPAGCQWAPEGAAPKALPPAEGPPGLWVQPAQRQVPAWTVHPLGGPRLPRRPLWPACPGPAHRGTGRRGGGSGLPRVYKAAPVFCCTCLCLCLGPSVCVCASTCMCVWAHVPHVCACGPVCPCISMCVSVCTVCLWVCPCVSIHVCVSGPRVLCRREIPGT